MKPRRCARNPDLRPVLELYCFSNVSSPIYSSGLFPVSKCVCMCVCLLSATVQLESLLRLEAQAGGDAAIAAPGSMSGVPDVIAISGSMIVNQEASSVLSRHRGVSLRT